MMIKQHMISLRALILDEIETWITDDGIFGGRNKDNVIRYFKSNDKAKEFSRGIIKGPHPGIALKKKKRLPNKEKKTDTKPDM